MPSVLPHAGGLPRVADAMPGPGAGRPQQWTGHSSTTALSSHTADGNITSHLAGQLTQLTDGSNPWSISNSANGADIVRAQWSTTGSGGPWSDVGAYDSDFTIANTVAPGGTVTVWLRIQTPTSSGSFVAHASTLKVFAR